MADEKRDVWLTVIGIGKLFKVASLLTLGVASLTLMRGSAPLKVAHWASRLGLQPGSHLVQKALGAAAGLDRNKLGLFAGLCFAYAVLFAIEGIGLLTKKRWAEYFTIAITGSFLPLEVYEIARHATAGKIVFLVLNVAALIYLVWHVRHTRRGATPTKERTPGRRDTSSLTPARAG